MRETLRAMGSGRLAARVRNPAYTGANRCLPCTVVNVGIAVGLAGATVLVGAVAGLGATGAVGAAGLLLAVSLALIYLRGYLVPGTPELTKRYLPERVLVWFGKAPQAPQAPGAPQSSIDPSALLVEMGILLDVTDDDLVLDPEFEARWRPEIEALWDDQAAVKGTIADLAAIEPDRLVLEEHGFGYAAWYDREHLASWESRAACVADAAGARVLTERDRRWRERPVAVRAELLGALRLFLDHCPACDGQVSLAHNVVESCCSSRDVVAATCADCDARLFEVDVDGAALLDD